MKYVKILEQKKLKKEDLAKQTQKKIDQLENLKKQLDEFDKDDFDEEDKEKYDFINSSIIELDAELEKTIRKFDLEIYKKRLEVFAENRTKGKEKPATESKVEPVKEAVVVKDIEEALVVVPEQESEPEVEVAQPKENAKVVSIREKLSNLKKELQVDTEKFDEDRVARREKIQEQQQEAEEVEVEEVDEYERKAQVKPKKGSLSIVLMTVGFAILTFGSVMYYKERR